MKKTLIIISIVVAVALLIAISLVRNRGAIQEKNKIADRSNIAVAVSVFQAAYFHDVTKYTAPATLESISSANISSLTQGRIESLHIDLGTKVARGQVIGTIDSRLKRLNLQSAWLILDKLDKDYQRYKDLYQSNAATEMNYNEVKYNYENAKVQVAQIEQQIADCNFLSPISGIITSKNMEQGEYANPGTIIATVVDVSQMRASVMVEEGAVYEIKVGQTVTVTCDIFPMEILSGRVVYVSPKGDENHNYKVEIVIADDRTAQLKAGTYVRVKFELNHKGNVLQIPRKALVEGVKNPFVFVVKDSVVEARKIVLGRELGENAEVVSGLEENEPVVISGQINLSDGAKVRIINNN